MIEENKLQTFLPYPSFSQSALVLDYRRLGKQRSEALQILRTLLGITHGWKNHPAVKMWRGYEYRLAEYGFSICAEWVRKGYKDTCAEKIYELTKNIEVGPYPDWLGLPEFHLSHQSNLIRKKPEFYRSIFGENIPNNLPYIWPV
jgi:hypothetical protein